MSTEQLDAIDYRNGTKNNWRRRAWNIVADSVRERGDAVVLYLPGSANLDLKVALDHGFKQRNMICIERDKAVARHLRRQYRQTVIDERLTDVMLAWPDSTPVSVIVADMVCGLEREALGLLSPWLGGVSFAGSTLVLNVMRGRETHWTFKILKEQREKEWWPRTAERLGVDEKHRGMMAVTMLRLLWSRLHCPPGWSLADAMLAFEQRGMFDNRWKFTLLPGYRSTSGQYFDSVIATDLRRDAHLRGSFAECVAHPGVDLQRRRHIERVHRRLVAATAVRTMRAKGTLPMGDHHVH